MTDNDKSVDSGSADLDALYLRHADEWVSIFETYWKLSENPVFPWMAITLLLHQSRPAAPLPGWVAEYLYRSANNLMTAHVELNPPGVLSLIGRALGLSADKRNIFGDARSLWNAPLFVGIYESLVQRAPGTNRAEWACGEIRGIFGFQSDEAARVRVIENRMVVRALLVVRNEPFDDAAISKECGNAMLLHLLLSKYIEVIGAQGPRESVQTLKAIFDVPPPMRDAVEAALRDFGPMGSH